MSTEKNPPQMTIKAVPLPEATLVHADIEALPPLPTAANRASDSAGRAPAAARPPPRRGSRQRFVRLPGSVLLLPGLLFEPPLPRPNGVSVHSQNRLLGVLPACWIAGSPPRGRTRHAGTQQRRTLQGGLALLRLRAGPSPRFVRNGVARAVPAPGWIAAV